jgi:hypothetical protein
MIANLPAKDSQLNETPTVNKGKAGAIELKIYAESVDMNWTTVLRQEQGDHISKRIISATGLRCVIQR